MKSKNYRGFRDLIVYQKSYDLAIRIFHLTKSFPGEEKYALTDQIRRSSRSVPENIAESWPKRRYPKSFVSKIIDSLSEEAETESLTFLITYKTTTCIICKMSYSNIFTIFLIKSWLNSIYKIIFVIFKKSS